MPRFTAAVLVLLLGALAAERPAQAKPGGSLQIYKGYVAHTWHLKPSGTKRVEGGTASDWYYSFAGKTKRGLPVELTVQAGADKIYSQALTITTTAGRTADVDEVVALAERFWSEATGGHGQAVSREIAPKIAAGQPSGVARHKDVAASLTKVGAGNQIIWVAGAEYQPVNR
jgi:hypothetical protein